MATAPSLAGYDFSSWSTGDAAIVEGSFIMPSTDVAFTGAWTPHSDTPYMVERYHQNTDDDAYTLVNTAHYAGTTDTVATVSEKTYPGFTITPASMAAATSTNIDGDGSTVLQLYYDRNIHTVSYAYAGTTDITPPVLPVTMDYRYGQAVDVATDAVLLGYDFSGWETTDVIIVDDSFSMPDAPVTLTGTWVPRADTSFTVEYHQQNVADDSYALAETFHGTGTTGANIPHWEFEGFTQTPDSVTAEGDTKIASDGSTVLKLYYDRNVHAVTYTYAGATDITPPALPADASYRYGAAVSVNSPPPVLPGYDFGGWETSDAMIADGSFPMPDASVTVTGIWTPRADTPYTVEYHQQNVTDNSYTLEETYNGTGTTGANIPHREFEGFTQTPDSVTAEGNTKIASDGSTVLKLYYDRDVYAIAYAYSGSVPKDAPALPEATAYRFGATVTLPEIPTPLSGMNFSGWLLDGKPLLEKTFSVPAENVTLQGQWNEAPASGDDSPHPPPKLPPTQPVVQTLGDNGSAYIIGYENGTFHPDDFLTAKHEVLMLSRLGLPVTPLSGSGEAPDVHGTLRAGSF